MYVHRLTTIAARQRRHLVRDLAFAVAGLALVLFYVSALTRAMQPHAARQATDAPAYELAVAADAPLAQPLRFNSVHSSGIRRVDASSPSRMAD